MAEFIFNLRRFADNGGSSEDDTLTAEEKEQIRNSSLPHLRMISNVAKNPIFSAFISVLENNKDALEILDKNVAPIYNLVGALYKRQFGKNATRELMKEAALFASTVKIVDSILDIYDNLAGADAEAVTNEIFKITDEAVKIGNKLGMEDYSGIFSSLSSAALSYGLTVLTSIDNLTPEAQTKIYKSFVKVGGTTVRELLKEVLGSTNKFTAPFGLVDLGVSVMVGIVEGFSQMDIREEYYSDDGLPEDIARKEALLDALSSGLHETFHSYLKGADDIAFKTGQFLGEGCKWLANALSGNFNYEITVSDKNYMDYVREIAKRGEYNSTSTADALTVSSSGVSLYAQDGDDYIENFYSNVTILAGHGNDIVSSYGSAKYNSILGGNGNDYLYVRDTGNTIEGGKNNDHLFIYKGKNIVSGNEGGDILFVQGEANTVNGGASTDLIYLDGATKTVIEYAQGDGVDAIYGYDTSDVIKIKGDYSTLISGDDVIIQVGDGGLIVKDAKDLKININTIELEEGETLPEPQGTFISNPYDNAVILTPGLWGTEKALRGTNGNDRIENTLDNIMIYGLGGDDTIINYGKHVTINSGAGNDHVENYGASVKINGGDDNDYIYNEAARVTISGGGGKDTIENSGNNSRIDGGDDMDSIKNSGENTDINSGYGNDRIINLASNARISGYDDINYIENTKSNVTVEGGDDDDYIYDSGSPVSINAGAGNNSISIDGSAGGYNTIVAGTGNDTVQVGERDETEGNRSRNRISIEGGNNYINNSNVELSTISTGDGNDTIITGGGTGYYNTGYYYYPSIHAGAGDNQITINSAMSYGKIYAGAGNDLVSIAGDGNNNIISVGDGRNTLITDNHYDYNYNVSNTVTAGSGSDIIYTIGKSAFINAGSGRNSISVGSGRSNTIVTGKGDDTITFGDDSNNNVIIFGEGNDLVINYHEGDTVKAAGTLAQSTVGSDVILIFGKSKMTLQGAAGKRINTQELSSNDAVYKILVADKTVGDTLLHDGIISINPGDSTPTALNITNTINATLIEGTELNDTITNSGAKVTITGNASDDTINNSGANVLFKYAAGDGNDLITGFRADSTLQIGGGKGSYSAETLDSDIIVTVGDAKTTLRGAASLTSVNINGVDKNPLLITGTKKANTFKNMLDNATISALDGKDTIRNYGDAVSIDAGAANDNIRNYGDDSTIAGGAGNDVIRNYADNVTITGGTGNDTLRNYGEEILFKYASGNGNDIIYGFNENSILSIGGGAHETTESGKDIIVTVGKGKITLKNAAGIIPNIINPAVSNLDDSAAAKITLSSAIIKADASTRTKAIRLVGNASDNSIFGGSGKDTLYGGKGNDYLAGNAGNDKLYGQGGNDTLWGGVGNDSLAGSDGSDTFIYNNGEDKDIIFGFDTSDLLQITGTFSASYSSKNKTVAFKVGSTANAITLKDFTATTFNVNGSSYVISGSSFVKK